jgi:NAD(P)-dependent dehydrogenase (short-subunit alcohol dehydrogenase family)
MIINPAEEKVFVTGGSRGLGSGIVGLLASADANVAMNFNHASDRAEQMPHLISPVRSCRLTEQHT